MVGESAINEREGEGDGGKREGASGGGEVEDERGPGSDVHWWLALPHPRAQQLLVRQATTGDVKKPGAARESQYYRKYGNPNTEMETVDLRYIQNHLQHLTLLLLYYIIPLLQG